MTPERIAQIQVDFPWLPRDYLRTLSRVDPASPIPRYGATWFDGPQAPSTIFGASQAASFPSALWIARRGGNPVGYAGWESGSPTLYEWAGSQRKVVQRFDSIAALALASLLTPGHDSRPVVAHLLRVPGLALGPWHDAGTEYCALGILLPEEAGDVLDALQAAAPEGWQLCLAREDIDSWLSIRSRPGQFELRLDRHGLRGTWMPATAAQAAAELRTLAPFNDGSHPARHSQLTVPRPV